jgi:hypothetical protein
MWNEKVEYKKQISNDEYSMLNIEGETSCT